MLKKLIFCAAAIVLIFSAKTFSQEAKIELGLSEIALNQAFTISIVVENGRLESYDKFPEIPGFVKRGTSSSSSTNIVNGQISSSQSIIQNYVAQNEGNYPIKPFVIEVNGKSIRSAGKTVKVGPVKQTAQRRRDPFGDFFGTQKDGAPQEFLDVKDEAFLALSVDKREVYVGEGFNTTLAWYLPLNNRASFQFYDLPQQVSDIVKQIKPANCWEENFNIEQIEGEELKINGKIYTRYKLYEAAYYPLNLEKIEFPSFGLKMIKYKVAKNPSFFGQNRQEDFKTFYAAPKSVTVRDLPPHPLKDRVAVGEYRLNEKISSLDLETGKSFDYFFEIKGQGNISALEKPTESTNSDFDFYPPNINQKIFRNSGRVTGSKSFLYYGIPNEPGSYNLGDYFDWIFFDPIEEKYDTLKSEILVKVIGESKRNESISSRDLGSFYELIDIEDNTLTATTDSGYFKLFVNLLILILLGSTAILLFKKVNG